ncbi:MAG: hypothetical protein JXR12_05785 [Neptunomonas phycophila]|uniref:hypothetical protein n=1 Tax=Neptunomonas phycophila TaxID=1572645 RepID=UPI003B8BA771
MFGVLRAASGNKEHNPEGYSKGVQEPSGNILLNHREIVEEPVKTIPPTGGLILNFTNTE